MKVHVPLTQRPSSKYASQCASAHTDDGGVQDEASPASSVEVGLALQAELGAGTSGGASLC